MSGVSLHVHIRVQKEAQSPAARVKSVQYFWFSLDIIMHDQSKLEKYMYMWHVQEHQKLDTQPLVNFIFNWQTFGLVISA